MATSYIVGVDLGKSNDPTATCIIEVHSPDKPPPLVKVEWDPLRGRSYLYDPAAAREWEKTPHSDLPHRMYHVRRLERFRLGERYTEYIERIVKICSAEQLWGSPLVVDQTGVGEAAVDVIAEMLKLYQKQHGIPRTRLVPILITGGTETKAGETGGWHVPKRELVGNLDALLGSKRLVVERGIGKEAEVLRGEFGSFGYKITKAANEVFEARQGEHDDLVLAVALAVWWGEHGKREFWMR
jgi:hypothetical protein